LRAMPIPRRRIGTRRRTDRIAFMRSSFHGRLLSRHDTGRWVRPDSLLICLRLYRIGFRVCRAQFDSSDRCSFSPIRGTRSAYTAFWAATAAR